MLQDVGIAAVACIVPPQTCAVRELFEEERADWSQEVAARLGVECVHLCAGESGAALAVQAARQALERAGVLSSAVDAVIDYTTLPQDYLAPAWNMSNKVQYELGAPNGVTIGLSGGGASNVLVGLSAASGLIRSDEKINTVLLVAADVTIPGNRILNPDHPRMVLGDGASAIVVRRGASGHLLLDAQLRSDGGMHDVCYIPGGSLAHPDRPDLYRMILNEDKYIRAPKMETLKRLTSAVLDRAGLGMDDIACFIYPNFSAEDLREFASVLNLAADRMGGSDGVGYGHMQGNDLVLNFQSAVRSGKLHEGDYALLLSHGLGFTAGVTLIRE